jgi:hypothetical protein
MVEAKAKTKIPADITYELSWDSPHLSEMTEKIGVFSFKMCGLKFEGALFTFYIKPADGKDLPKIMQWVMNFVHDELRS